MKEEVKDTTGGEGVGSRERNEGGGRLEGVERTERIRRKRKMRRRRRRRRRRGVTTWKRKRKGKGMKTSSLKYFC